MARQGRRPGDRARVERFRRHGAEGRRRKVQRQAYGAARSVAVEPPPSNWTRPSRSCRPLAGAQARRRWRRASAVCCRGLTAARYPPRHGVSYLTASGARVAKLKRTLKAAAAIVRRRRASDRRQGQPGPRCRLRQLQEGCGSPPLFLYLSRREALGRLEAGPGRPRDGSPQRAACRRAACSGTLDLLRRRRRRGADVSRSRASPNRRSSGARPAAQVSHLALAAAQDLHGTRSC